MQPLKKNPKKQLEKFSTIFMQIGLVLTLFIVHLFIELETEESKIILHPSALELEDTYTFSDIRPVVKEQQQKKIKKKRKKVVSKANLSKIEKGDNEKKIKETVINVPKEEPQDTEKFLSTFEEAPEPEDIKPLILAAVERAPIFRGCENLSLKETKDCFERKLRKFVQRRFDVSLADDLGLRSGKHRIISEFIIDEKGSVIDIRIAAPHSALRKETKTILNKLPQFKPGSHNGKPVKVKYTLPITFMVE